MTLWIILSNLNEINFHKMDVGEGGVKRSLPRNCRLTITLIQQTLACKKKKKKMAQLALLRLCLKRDNPIRPNAMTATKLVL